MLLCGGIFIYLVLIFFVICDFKRNNIFNVLLYRRIFYPLLPDAHHRGDSPTLSGDDGRTETGAKLGRRSMEGSQPQSPRNRRGRCFDEPSDDFLLQLHCGLVLVLFCSFDEKYAFMGYVPHSTQQWKRITGSRVLKEQSGPVLLVPRNIRRS